mmetsp:Transcript_14988/g.35724  ORF Transcript_14988/g.35724 Transcript_14988/m.35724 type:complete len:201 (-) Transcript_14988:104-706(-)
MILPNCPKYSFLLSTSSLQRLMDSPTTYTRFRWMTRTFASDFRSVATFPFFFSSFFFCLAASILSGSTVALIIFSLSYGSRQFGQRPGRFSFAASSIMWCQHHRHMLYPQVQRLAAWSVTSRGSIHRGHVSSSSSSNMAWCVRPKSDESEAFLQPSHRSGLLVRRQFRSRTVAPARNLRAAVLQTGLTLEEVTQISLLSK